MSEPATKFLLGEEAIPTHWINLAPELPGEPLPPLSPQTGQPAGPDDLTPIFPMGLIAQEVSAEPEIAIPSEPVGWAACARPDSVRSDGERCTVAPQVSIIARRYGFWS